MPLHVERVVNGRVEGNKALSLDPLKRDALVSLFLCYEKTGDVQNAQEMWSRTEALGGPMLLG